MSAPVVAQAAIQIRAPVALIWAILLDVAAYKEWNPFIVEVTDVYPPGQPLAVDTEFTLHCEYSDGTTTTSREAVTEVTPPGYEGKAVLAYRYGGPVAALGVVEGTRYQWLEQDDTAAGEPVTTRYRTQETFTGPGAPLVPRAQVQDGFERMAAALKLRAESQARH